MFINNLLSNSLKTRIIINMSTRFKSDYKEFKQILDSSKNIVVVTGAGVSAESGIPVFRGAGGLWESHKAIDLASPHTFARNPALVWKFYNYRREVAFQAKPNNAHVAIAAYEKICNQQGRSFHVITQNVDGLHQRAGSQNVLELHGTLYKVKCTKCKSVERNDKVPICDVFQKGDQVKDVKDILIRELPHCSKCVKGLLRPYIVWFGENLDPEVLSKSKELINECDLCIVVGTSSVVYPAAMFAPTVAENGKPVAEFNINAEPFDSKFSYHFSGPCGTTLPQAFGVNTN